MDTAHRRYISNEEIVVEKDDESGIYTVSNEKGEELSSKFEPVIGCRMNERSFCTFDDDTEVITCLKKKS